MQEKLYLSGGQLGNAGKLVRVRYVGKLCFTAALLFMTVSCKNDQREPGIRSDEQSGRVKAVGKLTFALPTADWWTAAPFILPSSKSSFQKRGLDLATLEVNSGLASKNAVVAGTADVGLCAATPLALAAAKREGLVILGTYLRASGIVGLVKPRDAIGAHPPEPVAIVPSTISEWFLYEHLSSQGKQDLMESGKLRELHSRPADIPAALRSGSAKSAVIWEPFLTISAEQTGFVVDSTSPAFEVQLYLITRPSVLKNRAAAVKAFQEAVEDSCRHIRENTDGARRAVEQHFGFRADFLTAKWPTVDYRVTSNRLQMEKEITRDAKIAKALGYISEVPSLNYMFISPELSKEE